MAILRVDCGADGVTRAGSDWATDALRLGRGVAATAPTVVMIHGYRYDPAAPRADPHALLYCDGPVPAVHARGARVRSWPGELGFTAQGRGDGLAVAFGWGARSGSFASTYAAAGRAGVALADVIDALAQARSGPIDMFAHSLGARVALLAIGAIAATGRRDLAARIGRVVLMGPAEFAGQARAVLAACDAAGAHVPEIYAMLARGNNPFDLLFEAFAPWRANRGGGALGRCGLGLPRAGWLDLAFDDPRLVPWLAARGIELARPGRRFCHWSFYARPGAMALHRAILGRAPGFGVEDLRADGVPVFAPRRLRLPHASRRADTPAIAAEAA